MLYSFPVMAVAEAAGRLFPGLLQRSQCRSLLWAGLFLLLLAAGSVAKAGAFDYAADPTLTTTTVDISAISNRPVRLVDILDLVEKQTNFEFFYLPSQLPLNDSIAVESGRSITLARLFYSISNLSGVVFTRRNLKVTVYWDGKALREESTVSQNDDTLEAGGRVSVANGGQPFTQP